MIYRIMFWVLPLVYQWAPSPFYHIPLLPLALPILVRRASCEEDFGNQELPRGNLQPDAVFRSTVGVDRSAVAHQIIRNPGNICDGH